MPDPVGTHADGEAPLRLRRSGLVAGLAFLLLVTSLLLPWWVVSNSVGGSTTPLATVSLFGDPQGIVHAWARWVTLGLILVCTAWLFVRVASKAWQHEPAVWHRDLGACASLGVAALASAMLWPAPIDQVQLPFWGGRSLLLDHGTGEQLTLLANPGLGWFAALAAVATLGLAWSFALAPRQTSSP
ncbi:MAG TPA: hypothetical protein VM286_09005 [Candidatus Thermoplasmatota archaeon]|nr:hypothetical protein [Candidatus Thermoplasmatota archaeon]